MKWNARDDDVRLEQESALYKERVLIVEQVLPNPSGHELWQDDGYVPSPVLAMHLLDVFEERLHE
jgi:hypothetical protein